ncbi:MAG: 2-hydroxymuconate tautomerase [Elusimicrobiota bacterium]
MPVIQIKLWKGRTQAQKKELIRSITESTVESIACPPEAVHVLIEEYKKNDWGIAGKPATELPLGK